MKTLSLSEAKMKLSGLIDSVSSTDNEIVITKNGRPAAVLVSPDEFDSWKETMAVRSDAVLIKEIKEGVKALKQKGTNLWTLVLVVCRRLTGSCALNGFIVCFRAARMAPAWRSIV